jgi:hypothetical protein
VIRAQALFVVTSDPYHAQNSVPLSLRALLLAFFVRIYGDAFKEGLPRRRLVKDYSFTTCGFPFTPLSLSTSLIERLEWPFPEAPELGRTTPTMRTTLAFGER